MYIFWWTSWLWPHNSYWLQCDIWLTGRSKWHMCATSASLIWAAPGLCRNITAQWYMCLIDMGSTWSLSQLHGTMIHVPHWYGQHLVSVAASRHNDTCASLIWATPGFCRSITAQSHMCATSASVIWAAPGLSQYHGTMAHVCHKCFIEVGSPWSLSQYHGAMAHVCHKCLIEVGGPWFLSQHHGTMSTRIRIASAHAAA